MKKQKKHDLKKLAMLGIAGGTMLANQGVVAEQANSIDVNSLLAFAGCGGSGGGCGASTTNGGPRNAYNTSGSQGQPYYTGQPQQASQSQYSNYQSYQEHSCSSPSPQQYYYGSQQQPSHSCSAPQPQWATGQQPSHGCAAPQPRWANSQQQTQWSNQPSYYTADAATPAVDQNGSPVQSAQPATAPSSQPAAQPASGTSSTGGQSAMNGSRYNSNWAQADQPVAAPMSESALLSQLNEDGKTAYRGLDPAGKALALKLASQSCKGQNDCKGLNSCKTQNNSCAGTGSCRGTSPGPFKDKNLAVKVAAKKMAEKRANAS